MLTRSLGSAVGVAVFGAMADTIFGEGDIRPVSVPRPSKPAPPPVFYGVLAVGAVFGALAVAAIAAHARRRVYRTTSNHPPSACAARFCAFELQLRIASGLA